MSKKFISVLAAFTVTAGMLPFAVFAAEDHSNEVHVIVENTTFTPDSEGWDDSFWYGELVNTWVDIDSSSTFVSCIVKALDEKGYTQTGAENNYIDSVNGLKAYDGGMMSGWMSTLNDWFANEGADAFTVENGKLSGGDEIRLMYSCNWGEDIGSVWGDNDTTIKEVEFSVGTLSPAFDKDIHEYTLDIPSDTDSIKIIPTASNKNYQVRTRIGDTVYKRTADVPVDDGAEIIIECNFEGSATMNSEGVAQTYTLTVNKKSAEPQDVSAVLSASMAKLAESVSEPSFGSLGGEWSVIALARGGYFTKDSDYFNGYYERIVDTVNETAAAVDMNGALHKMKSTENSRLITALSAIGRSADKVGDWDLTAPYEDITWVTKQGLSGAVWALIALDSGNYQTKDDTIRAQCVEYIMSKQLENGGWAFSGKTADPDMTAAVLQALSRYTGSSDVKSAVDRAVEILSECQQESGGFATMGSESCESAAQVITALTSLGIDPDTDARFVKNGNSAVDALLAYYAEDTQDFKHVLSGTGNAMATDQAIYALVSYDRLLSGKTALYDMSDVDFGTAPETPVTTTTTTATSAETTTTTAVTTTETTEKTTSTTSSTATEQTTVTTTSEADKLPETGRNSADTLAVCVTAAFMTAAGAYMIIKTKEENK